MSKEKETYLFVNDVPILFENRRTDKQVKIELWLDLSEIVIEVGQALGPKEDKVKWVV